MSADSTPKNQNTSVPKTSAGAGKHAKLSSALRDNLRRRKQGFAEYEAERKEEES